MKKYDKIEIEIYNFENDDIVTTSSSGVVDGEETLYPVPGDWGE